MNKLKRKAFVIQNVFLSDFIFNNSNALFFFCFFSVCCGRVDDACQPKTKSNIHLPHFMGFFSNIFHVNFLNFFFLKVTNCYWLLLIDKNNNFNNKFKLKLMINCHLNLLWKYCKNIINVALIYIYIWLGSSYIWCNSK